MRKQLAQNVLVRSKIDSTNGVTHAVGVEFKDCILTLSERSRRAAVARKKFPKALSVMVLDYDGGTVLILTFSARSTSASNLSSIQRQLARFLVDEEWVEYPFVDVTESPKLVQLKVAC